MSQWRKRKYILILQHVSVTGEGVIRGVIRGDELICASPASPFSSFLASKSYALEKGAAIFSFVSLRKDWRISSACSGGGKTLGTGDAKTLGTGDATLGTGDSRAAEENGRSNTAVD